MKETIHVKVRWVIYFAVFVVLASVVGLVLGIWAYTSLSIDVPVEDKPFKISLLKPFDAKIQVNKPLAAQIEGTLDAEIPLKATLDVPFEQTLHPRIFMDTYAPVKMTVPVKQDLKIDQMLPVDTKVKIRFLGNWIEVPLKGEIPVVMTVPLDLKVPVDQDVLLKFDAEVETRFLERVRLPIDQKIQSKIQVAGQVSVPLQEDLDTTVKVNDPMDVVITEGELDLPLNTLSLHTNKEPIKTKSFTNTAAGNQAAASKTNQPVVLNQPPKQSQSQPAQAPSTQAPSTQDRPARESAP